MAGHIVELGRIGGGGVVYKRISLFLFGTQEGTAIVCESRQRKAWDQKQVIVFKLPSKLPGCPVRCLNMHLDHDNCVAIEKINKGLT